MVIIAFLRPSVLVANLTVNEVLPPAGIVNVEGFEVIVKSDAWMPEITGFEIVNVVVPKFCITKELDEVPEGRKRFQNQFHR
ncbi:hypothetical protein H9X54_002130 [Flavobacterium macrobrachii]|uniref:Uncharacterized protein n=1 Tax=Flavobacterium macrobrachii TaxID=591204 RepID=A0ABS2CT64_9FLAO|nr:hypothetical protein [Flavobacterium macrobrachii]MBM6498099.1 hypothetical protein [Flavobacterium macrobrachii]